VIKKGAEKLLNYKDLIIDIQRLWDEKANGNNMGEWNMVQAF